MANTLKTEDLRLNIIINGDPARKELLSLEKSTRELKQTNADLRLEKSKLKKSDEDYLVNVGKLNDAIKENNTTIASNATRMKELRDKIGITALSMVELKKAARELRWAIERMTPGDPGRKKLEMELADINRQMDKVGIGTKKTSASISKLTAGFGQLGAALGISGGIYMAISAFKGWISKMSEFDDQIANVRKTTGLTRTAVKELQQDFEAMNTRTPRAELMALAEEAGRLGKSSKQDVLDFVDVANQIKVSLGDDLGGNAEEAIREVGKLTNIYKVGEQYGTDFKESMLKMGSAINEVSANSQAQAPFLIEMLKRMGGIADQANITSGSVIGYGSALDQLGQRTEMSSTALSKVILNMFTDTKTYADIAKISLEEFTKLLNTDANEAFLKVLEGLNGNNDGLAIMGEKLQGLGLEGSRAVQVLASLASNTEMIRTEQDLANKALAEGTSLTNEYSIKNNNLAGSIAKMKNAWDSFILSLSNSDGVVQGTVDLITKFINTMGGLFVSDDKNLEHFKKNQEDFTNLSAYNSVRLGGIATELMKKQNEVRTQDETSLNDWVSFYQVKIDELAGNESQYAKDRRKLYEIQISDLQGFIDEKKKLAGEGGSGETPEQKAARLAEEAAVKQAEISRATRELFMSDLDKRLRALDIEAAKLRETGVAEVDIARWVSIEKNKIYDSLPKGPGKSSTSRTDTSTESPYKKQLEEAMYWANEEARLMANNAAEANKFREDDLKAIEDKYNREKTLAETKYNEELLALGSDEEAKKALKVKFDADELQRNLTHLSALKTQMEQSLQGISLEDAMLSDEDRDALLDKIAVLELAIARLKLLANDQESAKPTGELEKMLFGFEDGDKLEEKIRKIGAFAIKTFNDINQIISNGEQRQLQEYQRSNDQKKKALEVRLNSGKISQEQYSAQLAALDEDLDKKKRKIEHDQAVRAKAIALMQTIINTAASIVKASPVVPLMVMAALIGALQIGVIASTPVPALAQGNRQKILADDGKTYNAKVADKNHKSGLFSEPTYVPGFGLFGETKDPELVFNPEETNKIINSQLAIDAINMTLGGARQYANGNSREIIRENNTITTASDPKQIDAMNRFADVAERMMNEGIQANLLADEDYIRTHKKKVTEYDTFKKRIGN